MRWPRLLALGASVLLCIGTAVTAVSALGGAAAQVPAGAKATRARTDAVTRPLAPPGGQAIVDRYCATCHNERTKAGNLLLTQFTADQPEHAAQVWEKVVRKVRTGMMPPAGAPRPDRATLEAFTTQLESRLDRAAQAHPNPGAPVLHRLNQAEYANAVRDLLDLPVDAATLLPGDDSSEGFDNVATVLSVSPALMQAYVSAAAKISRLAVGDMTTSPGITTYTAPRGFSQTEHREGLPLGTRGGIMVRHVFPLDADYEFRIARSGAGFGLPAVGADEALEITLNGERLRLLDRTIPRDLILKIPAGPQTIGVAIVRQRNARGVDDLFSELATSAGVQSLTINGPLEPTGPGDTPSRRRLFVCSPATAAAEAPCARRILTQLARRAFRRPVPATDPALATLMEFYESGRKLRGFDTGIQYALARVLADPQFLFRFEREPAAVANGAVYRVSDVELASRLSFFLWSSSPDDTLLEVAGAGRLREPVVLEQQMRRMLADPRARALVDNFAGQWLLLRQLDTVAPDTKQFDGNLRHAFKRETELLFETIVRDDRSVLDLIDADYTFVDERLARHYGIPNVRGSRFRRVTLDGDTRRGLLGHGSLLTVTSVGNRTSPVKRGKWILENLLGAPVPSPPPGVEVNLEEKTGPGTAPTSLRQRLEQHRANPACASCHAVMDPIGFSLENFDLVGEWRESDGGTPVNTAARLTDGTVLNGPASLRQALLARRESVVSTATEKLLTYALGRPVEAFDMPAVRRVVRDAARQQYRFSALVLGIVKSVPFQQKRKEGAPPS
jgi:mono/diheme cytochrome c family protein